MATNYITFRRIYVYEGALAYLQAGARFVAFKKINVSDNKMYKRAVLVVQDYSQFWLWDCIFSGNDADTDSAIIYANANRNVNVQTLDSFSTKSTSLKNESYMENCIVTASAVGEFGCLITVIDSKLNLKSVTFKENAKIYDDSYGIVAIYSELEIEDCVFKGPSNSDQMTRMYIKTIKDVAGGFLSIQQRSVVNVKSTTFETARARRRGGCVEITSESSASFKTSTFRQCLANYGGAIYASGHKNLVIKSSDFSENIAYEGKG